MGMNMQMLVRGAIAWELTNSYSMTAFLMVAFMLPQMFFTLPGGALVDRIEKRNMMILMQSTMATVALVTGSLVFTDTITVSSLFILGLVQGAITSLGMPARTPLMAEIVSQDRIASAMALSNNSMNLTRAFGPLMAGFLMTTFPHVSDRFGAGYEWAYFVQAGFGFLSVSLLFFVPTSATKRATQIARGVVPTAVVPKGLAGLSLNDIIGDVTAGLKYVIGTPRLRTLMLMMLVLTFLAMPFQNLMAGYVELGLGIENWQGRLSDLLFISGIGALFGSAMMTWLAEWDRRPLIQWVSGIICASGLIVLMLSAWGLGFTGAAIGVTLLGIGTTVYMTASSTMMLLSADRAYYGRVMSIFMLSFSAMAITVYPLGLAADLMGTPVLFGGLGILIVLCMLASLIFNPRFTFGRVAPRPLELIRNEDAVKPEAEIEQEIPARPSGRLSRVRRFRPNPVSAKTARLSNGESVRNYGLGQLEIAKTQTASRDRVRGDYGLGNEESMVFGQTEYQEFEYDSRYKFVFGDIDADSTDGFEEQVAEDSDDLSDVSFAETETIQRRPQLSSEEISSFFGRTDPASNWKRLLVTGVSAAVLTSGLISVFDNRSEN